uniref:Conserved oligomeric Golgi complex subunit 2 n=1 Tax=Araucaria cunninghamii TaxID=56994 RepID=A0A0D6R2N2_ARACU
MSQLSVTALFGEGEEETQQPLWFKKEVFMLPDFDSESYIADLRRFVALDTLRAELRGHLAQLKNELVELINRDYADFVNLSTKLVDVEGAVLRMRTPLSELRAKISSVKGSVESSLVALQNGLQRRAHASASREILELLLDTCHVISKVEKLMVELQSMPEEGVISHIEPGNKSSFGNGNVVEIAENGANLEETRSMLLERIASEMNRLKFYIARAQNLPFIQNMEKRIQNASLTLEKSLGRCFEIGLECHDESVIYNCLRAYAAIDNTKGAEETFRSTIVAPYIQKVIPSTPSREVVGGSVDKLEEDYQQIKTFVEKDCKFLLDITASANSGLHVFNFLANSVLKEVMSAIQKGKASALSPGKPAEFLVNYKSSMEFLTFLEGFCLSKSAVGEFRLQPVYIDFVKQWNLGAYFTLRFQEIATSLDSALATTSIIPVHNSQHHQDGVLALTLKESIVLLECLHRCWQDDVYIASIADKFLRLTLQLLSRYSTWLSTGLAACKKGNGNSSTSGEVAFVATPEDLVFVRHDVDLIVKEVNGSFLENVLGLLTSCSVEVLALVKQSILHASQSLLDFMPTILDVMIEAVVEKSVEVLRQLKGITATYRMTNKPLPVRHSPYVSGVLQPLKAFLEGERAIYLTEEARNELLQSTAERITGRYNELAWELVTVARKTESSLQRIRQGAQKRGGAGTDSLDSNISDTDKICMQLFLDVQEYGRRLSAIGVAAAKIPAYTSLWQCVAPPDKQSSIQL